MHCWDLNQEPLTYKKAGKKVQKKKKKKTRLGFEPASCWLQEQCSNLYTTETSQLNFFKKCPYSWRGLLEYYWHWHEVRVRRITCSRSWCRNDTQ